MVALAPSQATAALRGGLGHVRRSAKRSARAPTVARSAAKSDLHDKYTAVLVGAAGLTGALAGGGAARAEEAAVAAAAAADSARVPAAVEEVTATEAVSQLSSAVESLSRKLSSAVASSGAPTAAAAAAAGEAPAKPAEAPAAAAAIAQVKEAALALSTSGPAGGDAGAGTAATAAAAAEKPVAVVAAAGAPALPELPELPQLPALPEVDLSGAVTDSVAAAADAAAAAVDSALSVFQGAAASIQDLAQPALQVQATLEEVSKALGSIEVDTEAVSAASSTAYGVGQQVGTFLSTTEPSQLAVYALGLVAAYYLSPPLGKAALAALRGYAGDVPPTTALDALASQSGNLLVDIRPAKEKEAAGVADLLDGDKLVELEYVSLGDAILSERLRNLGDVEVESTAIQIAALKNLSKSMTLYIIDAKGSTAKAVARELGRRGFGRVFVVNGGYGAWAAAKLGTKPWENPSASKTKGLLPDKVSAAVY